MGVVSGWVASSVRAIHGSFRRNSSRRKASFKDAALRQFLQVAQEFRRLLVAEIEDARERHEALLFRDFGAFQHRLFQVVIA